MRMRAQVGAQGPDVREGVRGPIGRACGWEWPAWVLLALCALAPPAWAAGALAAALVLDRLAARPRRERRQAPLAAARPEPADRADLAHLDPYSGLSNRRAAEAAARAGLSGGAAVAVAFITLHGLAALRVRLGDAAYTRCLRELAGPVRGAAAQGLAARIDTERLAIVCPVADAPAAARAATAGVEDLLRRRRYPLSVTTQVQLVDEPSPSLFNAAPASSTAGLRRVG